MVNYSVLMSVYHKENPEFLCSSIESMLNQTVRPYEFVLVCDGKLTHDLDKVIESFCQENQALFKIIRLEENKGLGNALNIGLQYCDCELIARMDSDDISRADRCERQLKCFQSMDVDIVSGTVEEFEEDINHIVSKRVLPETNDKILEYSRKRNPFNHPCVMFKKSMVLEVNGYEEYTYFEDYQLWIKLLKSGAVSYNIQQPLLYMRIGSGMYKRRGGVYYAKCLIKFRSYLRRNHYIGLMNFVIYTTVRVLISLIPTSFRKWVYLRFLRNTSF